MVLSRLNKKINYPDIERVDQDDINHNSPLYQTEIKNVDTIIALGNVKFSFVNDKVLYAPVYLTKNYKVIAQVGVYEFPNSTYSDILDEDDDILLDQLDQPLLYSFVTSDYIKEKVGEGGEVASEAREDEDSDKDSDEDSDSDKDSDEDSDDSDNEEEEEEEKKESVEQDLFGQEGLGASVLPEEGEVLEELLESKADAETADGHKNWIQKFFKNSHYEISHEGGGGDCLFEVIRAATAATEHPYSVAELRKILSDNVTEEIFKGYREMYDMHVTAIKKDTSAMSALKTQLTTLKGEYGASSDIARKKELLGSASDVKKKYSQLKAERARARSVVNVEFAFMQNIHTLDDFKGIVRTCKFWADTWTISTLERVLNIKLILLSSQNYERKDYKNVLQCGQLNDEELEKKGKFTPAFYIITDYMGNHYKLVSYKGRKIFTFKDLPYGLVHKIVDLCMPKEGGVYNLVPAFRRLKVSIAAKAAVTAEAASAAAAADAQDGEGDTGKLFNEDIVFQFYSRSPNKVPGKGSGEKIPSDAEKRFVNLKAIKGWRKVLSNFYIGEPLQYDGHTWASVEHLYQALKFKKNNPDFYAKFSIESKSPFSKLPGMAKAAGGKTGIFTIHKKDDDGKKRTEKIILRGENIKADADFWDRKETAMETALRSKFMSDGLPKDVLIKTLDAKLIHYLGRGKGSQTWNHLMKIRKEI